MFKIPKQEIKKRKFSGAFHDSTRQRDKCEIAKLNEHKYQENKNGMGTCNLKKWSSGIGTRNLKGNLEIISG